LEGTDAENGTNGKGQTALQETGNVLSVHELSFEPGLLPGKPCTGADQPSKNVIVYICVYKTKLPTQFERYHTAGPNSLSTEKIMVLYYPETQGDFDSIFAAAA
jgi:hypothetical protein